jgi:GxxExxY protein
MTILEPQRPKDTKGKFLPVQLGVERIVAQVVDSAFMVHSTLGPGLLESVYEICLAHELSKRDLKFRTQVSLPIVYDGLRLDGGLRIDLLVENQLVVELKAVEAMLPLFEAQLLTYLKLTGCRLGLLINFNVPRIKEGIKRIIL